MNDFKLTGARPARGIPPKKGYQISLSTFGVGRHTMSFAGFREVG